MFARSHVGGCHGQCLPPDLGSAPAQRGITGWFLWSAKRAKYHGFPSGHAATAFGTATALAVYYPPVGIPVLAGAGLVGWSRMKLDRHFPNDIVVGGLIGIVYGLLLGSAARKPAAGSSQSRQ
ncbi:MAG: phosphatase PAP2 family protein [Blastochloris sp.]|nr:phosphatase PAP2 family protein [Blastochloris sp.]